MPKRRYKPEREPSPPLGGVFTRSRSEIFLHRTRSGLARPDPNRRLSTTVPLPSRNLTSIKDLRLRRFFSIPERTNEIGSGHNRTAETEEGGGNGRGDEIPNGSRASDDDSMQCTPPEAVVALGFGTGSGDPEIKDSKNHVEGGAKLDSKNLPKSRLGLAPCSRSKLVRNPSSFSYRRLLPFLTDLAKDEITPLESQPIKAERAIGEKLPLPCENLPPQSMLQLSNSEDPLNVQLCKTLDFVENSDCEISALDPPTRLTAPLNLCDGQDWRIPKPNSEDYLERPFFDVEHLHRPSYSPVGEALSIEEMSGSTPTIISLPKEAEVGHRTSVATLDIDKKPPISALELGDIHSLERHASSPQKGILKRYTRGCKGICMCLDCVSFRIHADRAYEFSLKQMEEADEMITGLLKELANLRNLVEKSVVPVGGNGSFRVHQFNQEDMKGACRRASTAEEIANNRRRQMFNDLNVHCRIPGPRVMFAECIEENDLSITPESTNSR